MHRVFSLLFLAAIAGTSLACDGPCQELADKICSCEPNETRERTCSNTVDLSIRDPVGDEDDGCEALLDSCTCSALDRGDFEACGLALPGGNQ